MAGILDGLKVLEVANWVAAPSTCAILADLGADVIKIEHPDTGDPVRSVTLNHRGMVPYTGGVNTIFELLNRGKKSLTVDLTNPAGTGGRPEAGRTGRRFGDEPYTPTARSATTCNTKTCLNPTHASFTLR